MVESGDLWNGMLRQESGCFSRPCQELCRFVKQVRKGAISLVFA